MSGSGEQFPKTRLRDIPWVRGSLILGAMGLVIVGVFFGTTRVRQYTRQKLETRIESAIGRGQTDLRIDFAAHPAWMDAGLLRSVLHEAQLFVQTTSPAAEPGGGPQANYFRLCNPLDERVLGELANQFMAHRALRENAWIKHIWSVQRTGSADGLRQTIVIDAEFRRPVAFVAQGNSYFLVDADGVLLPGEYSEQDHKLMPGLMVIRKVEESLPGEPGAAWNSPGGRVAIEMVRLLAGKPYAGQIAAVNMENFGARMDPLGPQIKLDTIFANPGDGSRTTEVHWGRAPGDEKFYEVSQAAKLKALNELFVRYNRIDAAQAYVDIRTEQVRIPRLVTASAE